MCACRTARSSRRMRRRPAGCHHTRRRETARSICGARAASNVIFPTTFSRAAAEIITLPVELGMDDRSSASSVQDSSRSPRLRHRARKSYAEKYKYNRMENNFMSIYESPIAYVNTTWHHDRKNIYLYAKYLLRIQQCY